MLILMNKNIDFIFSIIEIVQQCKYKSIRAFWITGCYNLISDIVFATRT